MCILSGKHNKINLQIGCEENKIWHRPRTENISNFDIILKDVGLDFIKLSLYFLQKKETFT